MISKALHIPDHFPKETRGIGLIFVHLRTILAFPKRTVSGHQIDVDGKVRCVLLRWHSFGKKQSEILPHSQTHIKELSKGTLCFSRAFNPNIQVGLM